MKENREKHIKIEKLQNYIQATLGAGYKMMGLAIKMLNEEISGFEELSGIPGTIGGAIFMNAGAYGKEMKDVVISTKCMDMDGNILDFSNEQQEFEYRSSIFQKNNYIILKQH